MNLKKDLNINEDNLLPVGLNIKDTNDIKRVVEEIKNNRPVIKKQQITKTKYEQAVAF